MAAKDSGVAGRELAVAVGGYVDGPAAQVLSEGLQLWWYVPCPALSYAMTMMWRGVSSLWCIYGIVLELSVHTRETIACTMVFFQTSQSRERCW